jgi:hypothetical protein
MPNWMPSLYRGSGHVKDTARQCAKASADWEGEVPEVMFTLCKV